MSKLYILPFDHRSSFSQIILETSKPDKTQKEKIKEFKKIIFNGLLLSIKDIKEKKNYAILVDEEYGKDIINQAKEKKIKTCLPIEKSGEKVLKLEYGKKYQEHINKFSPDYIKILIRYNPKDAKTNQKQLQVLSDVKSFCKENKYKTIIELLVPPTKKELEQFQNQETYDKEARANNTVQAIQEIKNIFKPTIWKLEGFEKKDWGKIITATKGSKIILLGRGEDEKKVKNWLKTAGNIDNVIGFAIGRTVFLDAIKDFHQGKISSEQASKNISKKFISFINHWEKYACQQKK